MPHADRRIRRSLGLLAVLGLSAVPLACGFDTNGSLPVLAGGAAGSGGTAGAGGVGGTGGSGGDGGAGGSVMCTPGATRACYSGPSGTQGVGICKAGTEVCGDNGMEWGSCEGQVVPAAAEDCTQPEDEDCNGEANEAAVCICQPGQPASCDTGLEGICAAGMGTCSADGKAVESCTELNKPKFEDCATVEDEDCDGTTITCTGTVESGFTPTGKNSDPMDDAIYDVEFAPDGGYVIAGTVDADLGADLFGFDTAVGSVYVAKVGADGQMQWAKTYPATTVGVARGVAVSDAGDIVVVGEFIGTMNFGGGDLSASGDNWGDIFVLKLNAAGEHVWSKRFGANNVQSAQDVDFDGAGNLYVTGWATSDNVNLGGNSLDPNMEDVFLASYDSAGNHRWSRVMGGGGNQRARHLTVTKDGNVALVGETDGNANIGGGNMNGAGGRDIIVGMYEGGNGNHMWSKLFGLSGDQFQGNIAAAPNGNVLITGRFADKVNFGSSEMTAVGATDVYVAELAANGNHVNSRRFGITGTSRGAGIAVDGAGHVIVTGHFDGSVDFGSGTLTTGDGNDVFVVKLAAANWAPIWTKTFGGTGAQTAWAAAVDGTGDVIVGGSFESQIAFGAPLGTITSSGGADLFGVRLAP
ncbi:SBBP repeat-containing protein [Polyangium sp. 15x6]|uniref:SBBP repeat-containing protein n=1 Tax=Polyangium sp. 15x6 TaxID=3042687 RepID=UPI00249A6581|nr:SBBP repeat-containing protein [Polyangium sp. 15x6]MDI3283199.1 SBBP repeat-containing protein [Polyangium sp. 15x6]